MKALDEITILTTATLRPKITERTFTSFNKNMFKEYTGTKASILNIDLIGEQDTGWWGNVLNAVAKVSDSIQIRVREVPSFPNAFKWLWSQVDSEFAFWLEDDWELLEKVDLEEMIAIMLKCPRLATLRLPYTPTDKDYYKSWSRVFPWTGEYFKCPDLDKHALGYCGHPSLYRTAFMREVLPLVKENMCPEKQIKGRLPEMRAIINRWDFGVFGRPSSPTVVKDIGRQWREDLKFVKDSTIYFTSWARRGN